MYTGTVDERLDSDAVAQVAAVVDEVHLVGPVTDTAPLSELSRLPNLRMHGPVGQSRLRELVVACDVGLLPHRITGLTTAMSPLKLYEYVAAGLPVVATDLPPVRGLGSRVILVPPDGGWGQPTRAALSLGPASETDLLSTTAGISWSERLAPLVTAVSRQLDASAD
ncbi:glycosyltransferase [Aquipuribacter nitratireducens]|uniref:Glycosyltransferase n=1 Tax=Aquipuribacter nitratireducens TaxID=650104 RepID=A0ABW0GRR5_9MICO